MSTSPQIPDHEKLEELRQYTIQVQRTIHPMDQVRAEATVDGALWKGFEKPTGIQKAGFIVFGSFFLFMGAGAFLLSYENQHDQIHRFFNVFGIALSALGIKIGSNAFRIRKKKKLE